MEKLPQSSLLKFNPDTLEAVRHLFNLDGPKRMEEAIDILQDWARMQDHFKVKEFERDFLENLIISSKGQLERCKRKLDKMCTFRTLLPDFFKLVNVKKDLTNLNNVTVDALLPTLTPENYRVYICKNSIKQASAAIFMNYFIRFTIYWAYLQKHDYNAGYVLIYDVRETDLKDLILKLGMNGPMLRQFISILTEGLSARIRHLVYLSDSSFINNFIEFIKPLLGAKLSSRLKVVESVEQLKDFVPLDLLPAEYGGKEKPLAELNELWQNEMSSEKHMKYLTKLDEVGTDEAKRPIELTHDLGVPGTFRTLTVD